MNCGAKMQHTSGSCPFSMFGKGLYFNVSQPFEDLARFLLYTQAETPGSLSLPGRALPAAQAQRRKREVFL